MLVEFKFQNFRAFNDENTLSMIATQKREHSESLFQTKDGKVLPTVVIYGSNASRKNINIVSSKNVKRNCNRW